MPRGRKKAARHIPKTAVAYELDGVTYHVDLRWGQWIELQRQIQGKTGLEAAEATQNVLAGAIIDVDGLEDLKGQPVEWDGDMSLVPLRHVLKIAAGTQAAEELMGELPSRTPSTPGPKGRA